MSILRIHPHNLAPVREYEAILDKETQGYRYVVRYADTRDWHKTESKCFGQAQGTRISGFHVSPTS